MPLLQRDGRELHEVAPHVVRPSTSGTAATACCRYDRALQKANAATQQIQSAAASAAVAVDEDDDDFRCLYAAQTCHAAQQQMNASVFLHIQRHNERATTRLQSSTETKAV